MQIGVALDAHATIGESPTWVANEAALYWIDVKAPALHRYIPETEAISSWPLTSDIGGFALLEGGGALVALREGLHRLDLENGGLTLLAPPPFDPALFRFNEAACDTQGRFWVGVMFDPLDGDPPAQAGCLHSFTQAGGLRPEPDAAELHNGMAWSADGHTFYLSHSNALEIFAFDYEVASGTLSNRRLFATIGEGLGIPDGAAIDTDGGYWCALHGGGRLRRFRADGSVDRDIHLPVSQPTMCAFAGRNLDTLFVTSASDKMSEAEKHREPLAGALFRLKPGEQGIERSLMAQ
ncbi:MAG: SMP-30/gluconolactonase/LRE family protein [Sphingomonadaceae bacterium]|nr:SMP-30/gluconolactonase/LRE family protein [Sphingomonadaceae bacterium]